MMNADSITPALTRYERMPCTIYSSAKKASQAVAADIANLIRMRDAEGRKVTNVFDGLHRNPPAS
jgi:hypothetical protein